MSIISADKANVNSSIKAKEIAENYLNSINFNKKIEEATEKGEYKIKLPLKNLTRSQKEIVKCRLRQLGYTYSSGTVYWFMEDYDVF